MATEPSDAVLHDLLSNAATIAVVGASSNPARPSHGIVKTLLDAGFTVIPVNPGEAEVLGQPAYPTLDDVPQAVDIVDVFRRAEQTPEIAEAAVRVGAKALWLQQGIVSEEAAARARAGGLAVVMDRCIGDTVRRLGVSRGSGAPRPS